MSRIQTTCYVLLASAFLMTTLLVARVADRVAPITEPAHAGMVSNKTGFTLLTVRTRSGGEESLLYLDDVSNTLMAYRVVAAGAEFKHEYLAFIDLKKLFDKIR